MSAIAIVRAALRLLTFQLLKAIDPNCLQDGAVHDSSVPRCVRIDLNLVAQTICTPDTPIGSMLFVLAHVEGPCPDTSISRNLTEQGGLFVRRSRHQMIADRVATAVAAACYRPLFKVPKAQDLATVNEIEVVLRWCVTGRGIPFDHRVASRFQFLGHRGIVGLRRIVRLSVAAKTDRRKRT